MRRALLSIGLILPPAAWFASLEANFALAPLACGGHGRSVLVLISAAAFGLSVAGGFLAWTQGRYDYRWLAISGAGISSLFSIVILAQAIPNLMLRGCE